VCVCVCVCACVCMSVRRKVVWLFKHAQRHPLCLQFELYNARDLEGFMTLFSDDITVTDMVTDEVMGKCSIAVFVACCMSVLRVTHVDE